MIEYTSFNRGAKPQRCLRCGWRGVWDQCPVHPRQGHITCPRCGDIPEDDPKTVGGRGAEASSPGGHETP